MTVVHYFLCSVFICGVWQARGIFSIAPFRNFAASSRGLPPPNTDVPSSTPADPDSISDVPSSTPADPDSISDVPSSTPGDPDSKSDFPSSTPVDSDSKSDFPSSTPADQDSISDVSSSTPADPDSKSDVPLSSRNVRLSKSDVPSSTPADQDSISDVPSSTPADPDSKSDVPSSTPADSDSKSDFPSSTSADPDSISDVPSSTPADPDSKSDVPLSSRNVQLSKSDVTTMTLPPPTKKTQEQMLCEILTGYYNSFVEMVPLILPIRFPAKDRYFTGDAEIFFYSAVRNDSSPRCTILNDNGAKLLRADFLLNMNIQNNRARTRLVGCRLECHLRIESSEHSLKIWPELVDVHFPGGVYSNGAPVSRTEAEEVLRPELIKGLTALAEKSMSFEGRRSDALFFDPGIVWTLLKRLYLTYVALL